MSGSGSSGGFGFGSGGQNIDCSNFSFETHIHSPFQKEVDKLKVNDVLVVKLAVLDSVEIVQILNGKNVVGGIVDQGPRLKQCLEKGFKFKATVRSKSGAAVKIFVDSL